MIRTNRQHGGIVVVVSLCVLGLALIAALAMETFRLLTSQLQMQNVAEYASEVVLAEIVSGALSQTQVAQRVSAVANNNRYLAQGSGADNADIDAGDFCFNNQSCTAGIKVLTGCYNPSSDTFTCAASPACVPPAMSASHVQIGTFSKRKVVLALAGLFGFTELSFTSRAMTYDDGSIFMTAPTRLTTTFISCG